MNRLKAVGVLVVLGSIAIVTVLTSQAAQASRLNQARAAINRQAAVCLTQGGHGRLFSNGGVADASRDEKQLTQLGSEFFRALICSATERAHSTFLARRFCHPHRRYTLYC